MFFPVADIFSQCFLNGQNKDRALVIGNVLDLASVVSLLALGTLGTLSALTLSSTVSWSLVGAGGFGSFFIFSKWASKKKNPISESLKIFLPIALGIIALLGVTHTISLSQNIQWLFIGAGIGGMAQNFSWITWEAINDLN